MKTYVIWFHIMLNNKQPTNFPSIIAFLVLIFHPSQVFIIPRLVDLCFSSPHHPKKPFSNVYCFVFINKMQQLYLPHHRIAMRMSKKYEKLFSHNQYKNDTSDHFAWKCRLKLNDQQCEDAAPWLNFRKQKIIVFPPWKAIKSVIKCKVTECTWLDSVWMKSKTIWMNGAVESLLEDQYLLWRVRTWHATQSGKPTILVHSMVWITQNNKHDEFLIV